MVPKDTSGVAPLPFLQAVFSRGLFSLPILCSAALKRRPYWPNMNWTFGQPAQATLCDLVHCKITASQFGRIRKPARKDPSPTRRILALHRVPVEASAVCVSVCTCFAHCSCAPGLRLHLREGTRLAVVLAHLSAFASFSLFGSGFSLSLSLCSLAVLSFFIFHRLRTLIV